MIEGGCYCGKIRFEVEGDVRPVIFCHCATCRKISGHYVAASQAPNVALKITGDVTWYESNPGYTRGFCSACGSQLFWRDVRETDTSIQAGAFDAGTKLEGAHHICTNEKADYYGIPK